MPLPLDQVLELVTGGLVELCAVLLLLALVAWVRVHLAAAERRERAAQRTSVVVGTVVSTVVERPAPRG